MTVLVPPIKCQGIKTKLVPVIQSAVVKNFAGRWVEPFCGSGVVAFNLRPEKALLTDTNQHIIHFYTALQSGNITPALVCEHLRHEGEQLSLRGEEHFYEVRARFNEQHSPLDFLFLNRSCFNGVMRFNKKGGFNVPFCRKPNRFAQAYVTKIVNQVKSVTSVIRDNDWTFQVSDFRETLTGLSAEDIVYADPPYLGRHTDYFNSWDAGDEKNLTACLKGLPCQFILSTWQQNQYRQNENLEREWNNPHVHVVSIEHFYHVGSSEDLRHSMMEALVTNNLQITPPKQQTTKQLVLNVD